jgi:hypothetical protein
MMNSREERLPPALGHRVAVWRGGFGILGKSNAFCTTLCRCRCHYRTNMYTRPLREHVKAKSRVFRRFLNGVHEHVHKNT